MKDLGWPLKRGSLASDLVVYNKLLGLEREWFPAVLLFLFNWGQPWLGMYHCAGFFFQWAGAFPCYLETDKKEKLKL